MVGSPRALEVSSDRLESPHKRLKTTGPGSTEMADSKEDASQSKTIEVERGAERVSFDRQELVRLLAQCLGDLGYGSTASALETESGVHFQEESIAKFRSP